MAARKVARYDARGLGALTSEEVKRLESIFVHSSLSLWEEDISPLRSAIRRLQAGGVSDLRAYVEENPAFVREAAGLINVVDVNEVTLELFGVKEKGSLLGPLSRTRDVESPAVQARLKELITLLSAGSRRHRGESVALTPDGRRLNVLIETFIPGEDDPTANMVVGVIDVTEQRRAERALRESERRLAQIIDFLPDPTFAIDAEGRVIAWNKAIEELTGVEAARMMGKGSYEYALPFYGERRPLLIDLVHRSDLDVEQTYTPIITRERGVLIAEMPFRNLNGREAYLWGKAAILYDANGEAVGAIESVRDILQRKRAEEALRVSEERFRNLVEFCNDWVWEVDANGRYTYASSRVRELLGYTPEEVTDLTPFDLMPPGESARVRRSFGPLAAERRSFRHLENTNLHKDGHEVILETSGVPILGAGGEFLGYRGIDRDITDRRRAERALRESEERYRTLVENLGEGVVVLDPSLRIALANPAADRIFGLPTGGALGGVATEHMTAEAVASMRAQIRSRSPDEKSTYALEIIRADGEKRLLEVTATSRYDDAGRFAGSLGVFHDVTERTRAEEALRQSEEKYHVLLDTLNEGILAVDRKERVSFVNPRMAEMLGYTEQEMLGIPASSFVDEATLDALRREVRVPGGWSVQKENLELRRKDGSSAIAVARVSPVTGTGSRYLGAIASVRDITEQRKAESAVRMLSERLAQSQKMEAIGRLAGGVAHDFNNLLTTILGNLELLAETGSLSADALELVHEIRKAGERAASLTSQLLAFGRRQLLQPKTIGVNALVENLSNMLRHLIREDITLELRLGAEVGTVRADPGQLEQVIVNLTVNARDAMPSGGRLTIETRGIYLDGSSLGDHIEPTPGRYVVIQVSDTGLGMDQDVRSHLFEPFYTTKALI